MPRPTSSWCNSAPLIPTWAAYRRGLQEFKDHGFASTAGDKAVAGIDRSPTELLAKAKERLLLLADARARDAKDTADRTTWVTIVLLFAATAAGALAFLIAVQRGIVRPLTSVVGGLSALSEGNTSVAIDGLDRGDEIGSVAAAMQRLKERMVEADRLRAERAELELQQTERRKAEMSGLADRFEAAVGNIVQAVSAARRNWRPRPGALRQRRRRHRSSRPASPGRPAKLPPACNRSPPPSRS
jgi:methyl-accepting chemotaxis protein